MNHVTPECVEDYGRFRCDGNCRYDSHREQVWAARRVDFRCWPDPFLCLPVGLGGTADPIPKANVQSRRAGYGCIALHRAVCSHLLTVGRIERRAVCVATGWSGLRGRGWRR
jgi:hypothetical protein